jgi:murein DD-endopeptidase MepM/ murein hydrolase activator NlpD
MAFHKPTDSNKITCAYHTKGARWAAGHHTGTDYEGSYGDPVYAVAGGKVVHANRMGGWGIAYGIHIIIESEGVIEGKLQTLYAHLSHVNLEVIGKGVVKAGDIIGFIGASGNANGPHLHLEMRVAPFLYDNKTLNPESVIKLANIPVKKPPVKKVGSVKK